MLISGPPDQPAGVYVQQYTVSTTSAMVQWKEADDNYKPVISYVVEGLNDWRGYWRILMTSMYIAYSPVSLFNFYIYIMICLSPGIMPECD